LYASAVNLINSQFWVIKLAIFI